MRTPVYTIILSLTVSLAAPSLEAANLVRIESKLVRASDTGLSVGVFIDNDDSLSALVLPLEFRTLTGGAYFSGELSVRLCDSGRFRIWGSDTTHFGVRSWYSSKTSDTERTSVCCEVDTSGLVWRTAVGSGDLLSPDAFLFAVASKEGFSIPPGSDTALGLQNPSLLIEFGTGELSGLIEMDTTCVWPSNHLSFVEDPYYRVGGVEFTKGIIEVCAAETLSGQITVSDTFKTDVHLGGPLSVDSSATLTILPTAVVTASDTARLEVFGSLVIATSPVARPAFSCDDVGQDVWDGIWIADWATVDWGNGCVIRDARTAVAIAPGASSSDVRNVTVINPVEAAFHLSGSARLVGDTIAGSGTAFGVLANGCDPTIDSLVVTGCQTGIYTIGSSGQVRGTVIEGSGEYGIRVGTDSEFPGIDTLRLTGNMIIGKYSNSHLYAGPSAHCLIDSCDVVTDVVDSLQSLCGVRIDDGAYVRVRRSRIRNCDTAFYSYNSCADLGAGTSYGYNAMYHDSCAGSCPGSKVVALCDLEFLGEGLEGAEMDAGGGPLPVPICLLIAEGDWWGSSSPSSAWFTNIDYAPWQNENPLGKRSVWQEETSRAGGQPRLRISNYPNPFNSATEIEFVLIQTERVRIEIFNILGQVVRTLTDREYKEGAHHVTWEGTDNSGNRVSSGVYLYRITAGDISESRKMLLLK